MDDIDPRDSFTEEPIQGKSTEISNREWFLSRHGVYGEDGESGGIENLQNKAI